MLTQLDDDGAEIMEVYAHQSNNKIKAKYNSYEGECLTIVWAIYSLCVICMVPHLFWLPITSL